MRGRAALIVLAGLLTFPPAASAVPLPPSGSPLPGSSFQGADGNQADSVPFIDWQRLQAAGRVHHNPDPNAHDSAFVGGSKENDPGDWDFKTVPGGVSPGKSNILDGWAAVDQPAGDTFLYLAFSRADATGTTNLAFELNRDDRLWNNGTARVPCRRTGDIVIAYRASGNDVDVILQQWTTTTTDPATGCARTGKLTDSAAFAANRDLQGAINAGAIQNYLPGFNPAPGTITDKEFGEASLNLATILGNAFKDTCLAFGSVWMHSRSSTSDSSSMEDYVAPKRLAVRTCAASGTKFFDSNANGVRDPGEPGIPRFLVWADYDNDGLQDTGEPFSVTDSDGHYVVFDIRPPNGTYMLRERLLPNRTGRPPFTADWTCSLPHAPPPSGMTGSAPGGRFACAWGPLDVDATPNATGRDFGNWYPLTPPEPGPGPGPGPTPAPNPDQPGPAVEPPGPTPPDAGDAGVAGVRFHQALKACISRHVPRIDLTGTRIASVRVLVDGQLRRNLTVRTLQRRVTPRVTLGPGRHRVVARVTFERGSGTRPLALAGTVRICAARHVAPRFTG